MKKTYLQPAVKVKHITIGNLLISLSNATPANKDYPGGGDAKEAMDIDFEDYDEAGE